MNTSDIPTPIADSTAEIAIETIGRYSRADLEAMHGKRGRKPPEYFTLFPERIRAVVAPRRIKAARLTQSTDVVQEDDSLIARLRHASPAVRRLVSDLLDVVGVPHPEPISHQTPQAESTVATLVIPSEPVYAEPELDRAMAGQA